MKSWWSLPDSIWILVEKKPELNLAKVKVTNALNEFEGRFNLNFGWGWVHDFDLSCLTNVLLRKL